jgi:DNA polymerase-1
MLLAEPGTALVALDLAQVEPRTVAALSGDPTMREALAAGDIYTELAVGVRGEGVRGNANVRKVFKRAFLAVLYGQGARSLGLALSISTPDAQALIQSIHRAYPRVTEYTAELLAAEHTGSRPLTIAGRLVPAAIKGDYSILNARVQATACDIFYAAISRVAGAVGAQALWMPIHDELVLQVPEGSTEWAAAMLNQHMATQINGVSITGTASVLGHCWQKP